MLAVSSNISIRQDQIETVLVMVDHSVSPIFADPDPLRLPSDIFRQEQLCSDLPEFDVVEFCDALSLACDWTVECLSEWTHLDPDAIFVVDWPHAGSQINYLYGLRSRGSKTVSEATVQEAVAIYQTRKSFSTENAQKLAVPLKRWIKSKSDQSFVDSIIDLGIALESLYFEDMGDRSELTYRLRLRAAWVLCESVEDRKSLMDEINAIYRLRSRAVHDGAVPRSEQTTKTTETAERIARVTVQT